MTARTDSQWRSIYVPVLIALLVVALAADIVSRWMDGRWLAGAPAPHEGKTTPTYRAPADDSIDSGAPSGSAKAVALSPGAKKIDDRVPQDGTAVQNPVDSAAGQPAAAEPQPAAAGKKQITDRVPQVP